MKVKTIGKVTRLFGVGVVVGAVLVGCGGGGGGSGPASTSIGISGDAVKGPMSKAKISLYKTTSSGAQGDLLTETTSDDKGHYVATVTGYSGIVLVVASVVPGTQMYDEATREMITPPADFFMRATIAAESGKSYSAQINPFTDLATAEALAKDGGLSATNVAQSNKDLTETLGFDPFSVAPGFDGNNAPTNQLAAALTALSEMAKAGDVGCTTGDQAAKMKCVTDALVAKGLDDAGIKVALQTSLDVIVDEVGLPVVKITQPSGTPVTADSVLAQVKAFFAMLRSNAKALDAADLSLQTELQAVSDDLRNRTVPIVSSSVSALELAMRGAQLWKDVIANNSATFVDSRSFSTPEGGSLGSCSFNSDTDYNVLATSKSNANYIACGTSGEWESAKDANGVAVYCQNVGDVCGYQWSTRVRLHPDAANPGKFAVYTQTRKAKIVLVLDQNNQLNYKEDKTARVQYGAAFPGNASVLTAQWDSNANPTTVSLTGELSPGFVSDDNWVSYFDGNQWVYKPATISVLGQKHNVTLSAAVTQPGGLYKLALAGSIDLIKNAALETRIELSDGSYIQGKNIGNYAEPDGSQEMLFKLKASSANSALLGDIKLSAFKADKSGQIYSPTLLNFNGSVQRSGVNFFEGAVTASLVNHADFDQRQPLSTSNPKVLSLGLTGKVSIPTRSALNIRLDSVNTFKGADGNTSALTGQYSQGSITVNLAGSSTASGSTITMTSTEGVKMVVDSTKSTYPLTFGASTDPVGVFNTSNSRVEYTDNTYEQF